MKVQVKATRLSHWRGGIYCKVDEWQEAEADKKQLAVLKADPGVVVRPVEAASPTAPPKEKRSRSKSGSNQSASGEKTNAEGEALLRLRPEDFTADGKPKVEALGELFGREVSAQERDRLWEAHGGNAHSASEG